jgi:hypothetical protein
MPDQNEEAKQKSILYVRSYLRTKYQESTTQTKFLPEVGSGSLKLYLRTTPSNVILPRNPKKVNFHHKMSELKKRCFTLFFYHLLY